MVKKILLFAIIAFSALLINACEVYNALYAQNQADAEKISNEDIAMEEAADSENTSEAPNEIQEIEGESGVTEEVNVDIGGEELSEDADVIIVEETNLVSLVPNAEDPDKDALSFIFTSPLDEKGEWKTNYGDAGEYTVTITASDGQLTATKEVLILVQKKEESPVIESSKPDATTLTIDETESLSFEVAAFDMNNDDLSYLWKIDGVEISDKNSMEYKAAYDDAGSHTVKIVVSDGISDAERIWSVTVNNINRKPQLAAIGDINGKETDRITITAGALDEDGDALTYSIDDERFEQDGNVFTWDTAYEDSGQHIFTLSVSDGIDTASQQVTVNLDNVNRAPVILDIIQKE